MNPSRKRNITQLQNDYKEQMELKQQHYKRRRRGLYRRLTAFGILVLLAAVLIASSIYSQSSALNANEAKKEKLARELKEIKGKKADLKEEIINLHDEDYVLDLARKDYYLSKDNETIFKIDEENK
ncbi:MULTISPECIES: FtsB family cell division protein [Bacillus]|uniref:Cell division protein DIVIC n=2 Tax=Bacillus TaxID=1386 RepID=A0A0M4FWQ5_9BACI|nr:MULTISPECIES: septum formation initiator family protein [Bacillus]ALC83280.1 cell division protein DIVIC [Bacillus gobiensis]MBP1084162.1 cell division protein DivIC [Bacillus capparidis]MED1098166.1 septum formation initiator family protein [Bacillus capparidis]